MRRQGSSAEMSEKWKALRDEYVSAGASEVEARRAIAGKYDTPWVFEQRG